MIKLIRIKNFQSHTDTEISFVPGVNVIIGRNMTGKSAVLRALRLIFYNEPKGAGFVTWDAKNAIIEVEYDGYLIRRIKGTQNVYEVDGSVFSGFGKSIPNEVIDVLGFSALQVDRNIYELNFDHPHDAPFFVSETDATKGKIFSRLGERVLADLLLLDKSIHVTNAYLRKLSSEGQVLESQIEITKQALSEFEPLVGVEEALVSCGEKLSRAEVMEDELAELVGLDAELQECECAIGRLTKATEVDISQIEQLLNRARRLDTELSELVQLRQATVEVVGSISQLESVTALLRTTPETQLEKAQQMLVELQSLLEVHTSLSGVTERITTISEHRQELQNVLDAVVADYRKLLLAAQKCPLCLRPVDEHSLAVILEELLGDDSGKVEAEVGGSKS